jgi:hypothetical protein
VNSLGYFQCFFFLNFLMELRWRAFLGRFTQISPDWQYNFEEILKRQHDTLPKKNNWNENPPYLSVKSGKDSTSTLNLVINRVRLEKTCKISTLAFKDVGWNSENRQFWSFSEFHLVFLSAPTDATYIFTVPTCTASMIPIQLCALNAEF